MTKQYSYVGPKNIVYSENSCTQRICVRDSTDIFNWIKETQQQLDASASIIATYIVDLENRLWIADRHCEHVVSAQGKDVLAAGEITFTVEGKSVDVTYISNQSTGYCPEPDSWEVVKGVLEKAKIPHPSDFSLALIFRRCEQCGQTNIVKEGIYECAVCNAALSLEWNFRD